MIELRGKKVVLRTMEREHCRTLWEHYELEEPIPTEPVRPGHSLEGSDKWFEEIQEQQGKSQIYLGIFSPDGNLLGDIQLSEIDLRNRTASLGAGIARRRDRGKGYCTDAALVILQFGFEHLDLYRISAVTASNNTGAIRVLEKLGFTQEGCEREAIYWSNRRWDRLLFGILRAEFESRHNTDY